MSIGLGLIPIGTLVNGYIRDQVSAKIPDTLLKIQEEVVPEIESQYIGLGIPEVLLGIREQEVPEIADDIVKVEAIPDVLLTLKNRTIEKLPGLINGSETAKIIDELFDNMLRYNRTPQSDASDMFFNNVNFQDDYKTEIEGVSEKMTGGTKSLVYSSDTQDRLLEGYTVGGINYPGLLTDLDAGIGVLNWLEFYFEAEDDIEASRTLIQEVYSSSWSSGQLQNLSAYIITYLWPNEVRNIYAPLDIEIYANSLFYSQWANGSFSKDGLSIDYLLDELADKLKSAEAADMIDTTLQVAEQASEGDEILARELFFNSFTFQDNYSTPIEGISERISGGNNSLDYTPLAQERILYGSGNSPGLLTEIEIGFGLTKWLDLYNTALGDLGSRSLMETIYNATWSDQLMPLGEYIQDYVIDIKIAQVSVTGLEVGKSYISVTKSQELWDPNNILSFVNDIGIKKWFNSSKGSLAIQDELNATFNLNSAQFNLIYNWLFHTIRLEITPILFTYLNFKGYLIEPLEYADILFLKQWANATLDNKGLDLGGGYKGFEVGIPTPIGIPLNITTDLFNERNSYSFINTDGILKWIEAEGDNLTIQGILKDSFKLNDTQLSIILNWLFTSFKNNVVPNIAFNMTGYTMTELAVFEFYRQWANGSLFINGIDSGPALGLESLAGWELGIPKSSKIAKESAALLWDEEYYLALVNSKGNGRWFNAMYKSGTYNHLKNLFSFTNDQMDAILDWLAEIRNNVTLSQLQLESGLQLNHYEIGNIINIGITIGGIVFTAISSFILIWIWVKSSKRK
ncbi:MAG: hypothetical protein V3V33_06295 [Candidatus Lokiarchaeia archaeon]